MSQPKKVKEMKRNVRVARELQKRGLLWPAIKLWRRYKRLQNRIKKRFSK